LDNMLRRDELSSWIKPFGHSVFINKRFHIS